MTTSKYPKFQQTFKTVLLPQPIPLPSFLIQFMVLLFSDSCTAAVNSRAATFNHNKRTKVKGALGTQRVFPHLDRED